MKINSKFPTAWSCDQLAFPRPAIKKRFPHGVNIRSSAFHLVPHRKKLPARRKCGINGSPFDSSPKKKTCTRRDRTILGFLPTGKYFPHSPNMGSTALFPTTQQNRLPTQNDRKIISLSPGSQSKKKKKTSFALGEHALLGILSCSRLEKSLPHGMNVRSSAFFLASYQTKPPSHRDHVITGFPTAP